MAELGLNSEGAHATDLSAAFYTHFQAEKNDISSRLEAVGASVAKSRTGGGELKDISSDIVKLRKDLVDATSYLPSYDRGKCEQQLKVLEEALSSHRAPKSKFAFKHKPAPRPEPPPTQTPAKSAAPPPSASHKLAKASTTHLTLSSHTSAHLTLSSLILPGHTTSSTPTNTSAHSLPKSSDITLTDLRGCIVNLFASHPAPAEDGTTLTITALHARSLHGALIMIPPIEGSVLLHDIRDSIVVVGCHQFRIHDSVNTTVLLHAISTPIIEGSRNIRFGAYPDALRGTSSQDSSDHPSQHAQAQDFDWIKPTPSPNWRLLAPEEEKSITENVLSVKKGGRLDSGGIEGVLKGILSRG